ncbi:MAG: NUDIX domain-containing protein [Candidatus Sungbacteria bacterium]|nr:NUDIX domain-containing protein [Candidatus Sungbacteria bacterium]
MNRAEREISAGAIVFRREGKEIKFLLLYHGRGYWNFPKGKIEKGERLFQTFLREVEEETGISRKDMKIAPNFRTTDKYLFFRGGRPVFKIVIFYLVETKKQAIAVSKEHDGYAWFSPNDAVVVSKFKNSKTIIKSAYAFIRNPYLQKQDKSPARLSRARVPGDKANSKR